MPLVLCRKVVILGCRSVGTASLAHQFMEGEFLEGYDPSTVEKTYSKIVTLSKDEFHLQLVDVAGQDEYSILPYSLIIGVRGYVLVYSGTSLHTSQVIVSLYQKLHGGHGETQEFQAVEGEKLAESWGVTFMLKESGLGWKIKKMLTQSIFTKILQEIAHVENSSYGQEHCCRLMGALRHRVAALILLLALARLQWG